MTPDSELLRRYADTRSDEAFAELLRRHLNLVYSAALRQVNGDASLAQDVAQTVFTDLARKAATLARRDSLTGWLYTSTRFAAANAVRSERRRIAREQEAHTMSELLHNPAPEPDWSKLRPLLDEAMHELAEPDREAILLRYFENRALAEVGAQLGLNENTARMRVHRALEKLRALLARRGIDSTIALTSVISANAVHMAPPELAATLASACVAATGTSSTVVLLNIMKLTKLKLALGALLLVGGGTTALIIHQQQTSHPKPEALSPEQSVAYNAAFEQHSRDTTYALKMIVLALDVYAHGNNHRLATNYDTIKRELSGVTTFPGNIPLETFEFVNVGLVSDTKTLHKICLRERVPRRTPDGKWQRAYAFADGSVHVRTSDDGNFDAFDKEGAVTP